MDNAFESAQTFATVHRRTNFDNGNTTRWGHKVYWSFSTVPALESTWLTVAWTKANGGKQFHGFSSEQQFHSFMKRVPKNDRHFEEVLATDRRQRFHLDLETDQFSGIDNIDDHFEFLSTYLENVFVVNLAGFFRDTYGFACEPDDFKITYACKARSKWSAHLVLSNNAAFDDRREFCLCALAMARFLDEKDDDPDFQKWYRGAGGSEHIIDYNIFSIGKRNMRMLGSVKRTKRGQPRVRWELMRPLLPMQSQSDDPWQDFLITEPVQTNQTMKLSTDYFAGLISWYTEQLRTAELPVKMSQAYALLSRGTGNQTMAMPRRNSDCDVRPSRNTRDSKRIKMAEILKRIDTLDDPERVLGNDATMRAQRLVKRKELKKRFYSVAVKLGRTMANFLHPYERLTAPQAVDPSMGEVFKIGVDTYVRQPDGTRMTRTKQNGEIVDQRLCFWSFQQADNGATM